jgi:hypothetical protein
MHLIFARQGDLVIARISKAAAAELSPTVDLVVAGDSSGHRHRLLGRSLSRRDGNVTIVRIAEPHELVHEKAGGHKPITLRAGDYEIRPLRERGDAGDRAVED